MTPRMQQKVLDSTSMVILSTELEIFSWLPSASLLQMSSTCRKYSNLLLNSQYQNLWRVSWETYGLPAPPVLIGASLRYVGERKRPQTYLELAKYCFGVSRCSICGTQTTNFPFSYVLQIKICDNRECRESCIGSLVACTPVIPDRPKVRLCLEPSTRNRSSMKKSDYSTKESQRYLHAVLEALVGQSDSEVEDDGYELNMEEFEHDVGQIARFGVRLLRRLLDTKTAMLQTRRELARVCVNNNWSRVWALRDPAALQIVRTVEATHCEVTSITQDLIKWEVNTQQRLREDCDFRQVVITNEVAETDDRFQWFCVYCDHLWAFHMKGMQQHMAAMHPEIYERHMSDCCVKL